MAEPSLDPTCELVTLFGRLPEVRAPLPPQAEAVDVFQAKKRCSRCREIKPAADFGLGGAKRKDGRAPYCRLCTNEKARIRQHRLRASPEWRRRVCLDFRFKNYGLTPDRFESMFNRQDGKCAICRTILTVEGRETHVDHCHKTGKVRAILCRPCNHMVGWVEKSGVKPEAISAYLALHCTAESAR